MSDILAIVGTRQFACPNGLLIARDLIHTELRNRLPDAITSGGAPGVDEEAEWAAANWGIEARIHRAKQRQWAGPGGFQERNRWIATTCTRLLRIACSEAKTYGSGWTAAKASELGKSVRQVQITPDGSVIDSGWSARHANEDVLD